jgi:hypothetical protein
MLFKTWKMKNMERTKNTAFVLINTKLDFANEVLPTLRKLGRVREAQVSYGTYNLVAKIEYDPSLKSMVDWTIKRLNNATSALTLMATN